MINNILHPQRLLYSLMGFSVACIVSYFGPLIYLQYVDHRQYISVPTLVTFDRKMYSSGETQTAKLTLKIDVSGNITVKSRLMLIMIDNQYRVIKQTSSESFVSAKNEPQTFVIPTKLPCNLEEGQYLYRGEIQYEIKGINKYTDFDTDIFTINNNCASDSAEIAKNCPT